MSAENTGGSKLAELVTYHVFSDVYRNKLITIVHCKSVTDEIWGNHRSAAPGLDNRFLAAFLHSRHFLLQLNADIWAFF